MERVKGILMWTIRRYRSTDLSDTSEVLSGLYFSEADAQRDADEMNADTGNLAFARILPLTRSLNF